MNHGSAPHTLAGTHLCASGRFKAFLCECLGFLPAGLIAIKALAGPMLLPERCGAFCSNLSGAPERKVPADGCKIRRGDAAAPDGQPCIAAPRSAAAPRCSAEGRTEQSRGCGAFPSKMLRFPEPGEVPPGGKPALLMLKASVSLGPLWKVLPSWGIRRCFLRTWHRAVFWVVDEMLTAPLANLSAWMGAYVIKGRKSPP